MRDYLVFAIIFATLPFILKRPVYGAMVFAWISLMNPNRLAYASAYEFPFAAIVAVTTLISMLMSSEPKKLPITPLTVVLMVFMAWMTITCFAAVEPERAWTEWRRVSKTIFMVLISMALVRTEKDTKLFAWVVGLSLAIYGVKGGIFTLTSGGNYRVVGPADSYIADNNHLALALLTVVPIIWYLHTQVSKKWQRYGMMATTALCIISAAGSYSRGALIAGAAMLIFLWIKSPSKLRTGLALLLIIPIVMYTMPEKWFARMDTIGEYKSDSSANGRINAWHFAFNIAADRPLGGGFTPFTPRMFQVYAPDPFDVHAPHSIYFQVLGEHGFFGLLLFLVFFWLAWRTGSRILRLTRANAELRWATNLARMCQVSLLGFAVGGSFLTLAYYDLIYDIVILLVALERLLMSSSHAATAAPSTVPPRRQMPARAKGEGK
jgi:probable O-glycosylation ligase (exosortase A-associated)